MNKVLFIICYSKIANTGHHGYMFSVVYNNIQKITNISIKKPIILISILNKYLDIPIYLDNRTPLISLARIQRSFLPTTTDSFADIQNFCHSQNSCICTENTMMCHHHYPTELATLVAMLLCCWYSCHGLCLYIIHVKFCSKEIMPMTPHDQGTFNVNKL